MPGFASPFANATPQKGLPNAIVTEALSLHDGLLCLITPLSLV